MSASALYSQAARAFLHRDFERSLQTVSALLEGLPAFQTAWHHDLANRLHKPEDQTEELRRKAVILVLTLLATVWTSEGSVSGKTFHSAVQILAESRETRPEKQFQHLLAFAKSIYTGNAASNRQSLRNSNIPISVAVALSLAGAKIQALNAARVFVEEYFDSLSKDAKTSLAEFSISTDSDAEDAPDISTTSIRTNASATLSDSGFASASTFNTGSLDFGQSLLVSLDKLADALCLVILPRLEQWDAALAWAEKSSISKGGLLRDTKAEGLRAAIYRSQRQKANAHRKRLQIAADIKESAKSASLAELTGKTSKPSTSQSPQKERRPSNTSKRSHEQSRVVSKSTSKDNPQKQSKNTLSVPERPKILRILSDTSITGHADDESPKGFAGFRVALARYLAPQSLEQRKSAPVYNQAPGMLKSIRYIISAFILRTTATDVIGALAGLFVVLLVIRQRARRKFNHLLANAWQSLLRTVKMGTTISSV